MKLTNSKFACPRLERFTMSGLDIRMESLTLLASLLRDRTLQNCPVLFSSNDCRPLPDFADESAEHVATSISALPYLLQETLNPQMISNSTSSYTTVTSI